MTLTRTREQVSSEEVRALRERYVPKGLHVGTPVVVARAQGAEVFDPEGKRYLDFIAGIGALNLGHQQPDIVAAVREQLEKYAHVSAQAVTYEPYVRLAQELDRIFPRTEGNTVATKSVFAPIGCAHRDVTAHTAMSTKQTLKISEGWTVSGPSAIHRRAPETDRPSAQTSARAARPRR